MCDENNYSIHWDYAIKKLGYQENKILKQNSVYFASYEKAIDAVRAVGEDRIKKYYLEVAK